MEIIEERRYDKLPRVKKERRYTLVCRECGSTLRASASELTWPRGTPRTPYPDPTGAAHARVPCMVCTAPGSRVLGAGTEDVFWVDMRDGSPHQVLTQLAWKAKSWVDRIDFVYDEEGGPGALRAAMHEQAAHDNHGWGSRRVDEHWWTSSSGERPEGATTPSGRSI